MIKLIIAKTRNNSNWRKVKKGEIESQAHFYKRIIVAIVIILMKAVTMMV